MKNNCHFSKLNKGIFELKIKYRPLIATTLLIAFVNFNIAFSGDSAALKVKFSMKNASVQEVMSEIENQTGLKFTYNNSKINISKKVNIELNNAEVNQALNQLFENTEIKYTISGKQIILYTDPKRKSSDVSDNQSNANKDEGIVQASTVAMAEPMKLKNVQDIEVSGVIVGKDDGLPLAGVSVVIKGTTSATVTDLDGKFKITAPDQGILILSYLGYETVEIPVATEIKYELAPVIKEMNEVVVVGYGQQKKQDVTGVVAVVDAKSFNKGVIISPDQLIVGKVAGVQITPTGGGEPGGQSAIRIRGGTSINASNEPLYVIDGFPIDNSGFNPTGFSTNTGRNPLNFLNPNDIESFTVLKDASAAAIYGSRGANGVIIITTKKGAAGKPVITYDAFGSFGMAANKLDLMNGDQYRAAVAEQDALNGTNFAASLGTANTNWMKEIQQTAWGQGHTISLSAGTDKTNYRISIGHQDQNGLIKKTNSQRTNLNLNFNQKLFNDKLNISANVKNAFTQDVFAPGIANAVLMAPTQPIYDATSKWGGFWEWNNDLGTKNPVAENSLTQDVGKGFRSLGNMMLNYKVDYIKGLTANVNVGYDVNNAERKQFLPNNLRSQYANLGEVRVQNLNRTSTLLEAYLNYNRDFANIQSKVDFTGGYSFQGFSTETPGYRSWNLTSNALEYNNPALAVNHLGNNNVVENRLISFYGRVNYTFRNKYILTGTVRYDGSSRFAKSNRWGVFPSAAFAWRIIDESFMSGLQKVFSDLKLRVGYGLTGNQEIGDYRYLNTYTFGDNLSRYQLGNGLVTTLRPNAVDPNLKWEQTQQFNAGLDFGFFKDRITGSIEYYNKTTSDLLFVVNVPAGSNLNNAVLTNIGKVRNEGVELALNGYAIATPQFKWNLGFNAAYNKNKVLALDGNDDPNFAGYRVGGIVGGTGNTVQLLKVGESVNSFYVYEQKYDGNGKPINTAFSNDLSQQTDQYVDQNGDGIINEQDRKVYKNPAPLVLLGLTSQMNYKGFDMSFTLRANLGGYVYNNVGSLLTHYQQTNGVVPQNMLNEVNDTRFTRAQYFSSYYVQNASFLRMDNISLGYTPKINTEKLKLRVYVAVQNAFIITPYTGLDPEVSQTNAQGVTSFGIDSNIYPRARTFTTGLNLTF